MLIFSIKTDMFYGGRDIVTLFMSKTMAKKKLLIGWIFGQTASEWKSVSSRVFYLDSVL